MRDIKFRALSFFSKEWIYGVPIKSNGWTKMAMVWEIYHVDGAEYNVYEEDIIPETIEEYTGLKDKNGVEIYEGDIVVIKNEYPFYDEGKPNYIAVVEWIFSGFQTVLYCVNKSKRGISDGVNQGYFEDSEEYEIIGNIHENPELLEGKI